LIVATVSDDSTVSTQLSVWLEQYCRLYQISPSLMEFKTTEQLLAAGKTHHLDVIFVCMSGPDGFLHARQIAQEKPDAKMVMIADTAEYAVKCMRLHFTDYIVRPLEFRNFVRAMKLAGVG